jgi:hypothetical protein
MVSGIGTDAEAAWAVCPAAGQAPKRRSMKMFGEPLKPRSICRNLWADSRVWRPAYIFSFLGKCLVILSIFFSSFVEGLPAAFTAFLKSFVESSFLPIRRHLFLACLVDQSRQVSLNRFGASAIYTNRRGRRLGLILTHGVICLSTLISYS